MFKHLKSYFDLIYFTYVDVHVFPFFFSKHGEHLLEISIYFKWLLILNVCNSQTVLREIRFLNVLRFYTVCHMESIRFSLYICIGYV